jgi:hypothetical protein
MQFSQIRYIPDRDYSWSEAFTNLGQQDGALLHTAELSRLCKVKVEMCHHAPMFPPTGYSTPTPELRLQESSGRYSVLESYTYLIKVQTGFATRILPAPSPFCRMKNMPSALLYMPMFNFHTDSQLQHKGTIRESKSISVLLKFRKKYQNWKKKKVNQMSLPKTFKKENILL